MKVFIIVEYKNGDAIWTDGKTYSTKESATYSKDLYVKHYKTRFRNPDELKILTLNLDAKKKALPTNNTSNVQKVS